MKKKWLALEAYDDRHAEVPVPHRQYAGLNSADRAASRVLDRNPAVAFVDVVRCDDQETGALVRRVSR